MVHASVDDAVLVDEISHEADTKVEILMDALESKGFRLSRYKESTWSWFKFSTMETKIEGS